MSSSNPQPPRLRRLKTGHATPTLSSPTHEAYAEAEAPALRTHVGGQASIRTRIAPTDSKLEVRIFVAALAAGKSVREAAKLAGLSERRIARWVAFYGFGPTVKAAQRKGRVAKADPRGGKAVDAMVELTIALQNRELQQAADRYASGDRDRLHRMWMSGELMAIYEREAIASFAGTESTMSPTAMSERWLRHYRRSRLIAWGKNCAVSGFSGPRQSDVR